MRIDDTHQMFAQHTRELKRVSAWKQARRIAVMVVGSIFIAAGIALLPVPGPFSIPLLLLGLTVLSWEFPWAKRLLHRIKMKIKEFRDSRRAKSAG